MVVGFVLAASIFFFGHWLAAVAFRRSLFRFSGIWAERWPKRLSVWLAGVTLCYVATVLAAFPAARAAGRPSLVVEPVAGMPAEAAGILSGDRVLSVDGHEPAQWDDVHRLVAEAGERSVQLELERAGQRVHVSVVPDGGRIGIRSRREPVSVATALSHAALLPIRTPLVIARRLAEILVGIGSPVVAGPVAIVRESANPSGSLLALVAMLLAAGFVPVLIADVVIFVMLSLAGRRAA